MRKVSLFLMLTVVFLTSIVPVRAGEVKGPVIDGMVLSLGNFVQRVKVRAKSLGVGACAVTFTIGGETTGFLAPPIIWSPWEEIGPGFFGVSNQRLDFNVECDTGAVAEVMFQK